MGVGRKPKPTVLKRLTGNPGKRPLNAAEPEPVPGLPACPVFLSDEARAEWHELGGQLVREQRMALVYKGAFAAYCQAWGRWMQAETKLRDGNLVVVAPESGFQMQSPWLAIANKALEQMAKMAAELGITPTSQARVAKVKAPATVSRLRAFVGGAAG